MNKVQKQQDEGFTIIEVVLVLAIAALIMLMVFIALPALQRNQRDTARQNDISRLQSSLNNYKSRSRGKLPNPTAGAYTTFFNSSLKINGEEFADPSGEDYTPTIAPNGNPASTPDEFSSANESVIYFYPGARCDGENPSGTVKHTARKVAIVKPLEGGGYHCTEA